MPLRSDSQKLAENLYSRAMLLRLKEARAQAALQERASQPPSKGLEQTLRERFPLLTDAQIQEALDF